MRVYSMLRNLSLFFFSPKAKLIDKDGNFAGLRCPSLEDGDF
jgi:hypothetical protein